MFSCWYAVFSFHVELNYLHTQSNKVTENKSQKDGAVIPRPSVNIDIPVLFAEHLLWARRAGDRAEEDALKNESGSKELRGWGRDILNRAHIN